MNPIVNRCWMVAAAIGWTLTASSLSGQAGASDPYQQVLKREFGTASEAMAAIEKAIQKASPDQYPPIEARLIGVLESAEATAPAKQFACQMLRITGSSRCIPAVSRLLTDEKLSHIARTVFRGMPGPAVDHALRTALGQTQGILRIGMINTIGDRGDRGALDTLAALLNNQDESTARATLQAIGKIGGVPAADILERAKVPVTLKEAWADACLRCAEQMAAGAADARAEKIYQQLYEGDYSLAVRAAAFGVIVRIQREQAVPLIVRTLAADEAILRRAALAAVIAVPGHAGTEALARVLPTLNPEGKAVLLGALAARGDAEGITDAVNKLAADEDSLVRLAAIRALGRLGKASSVPVLAAALKEATRTEAMKTMIELQGGDVVEALIKQAETGEAPIRQLVLGLLADRRQVEALPAVRRAVADNDGQVRQAALRTIATLGQAEDFSWLIQRLLAIKDEGEQNLIERALSSIGGRMSDKAAVCRPVLDAMPKAEAATKIHFLAVLSTTGSELALAAVRAALADGGEVKKAALRALAEWPNAAPVADLLNAAKEDQDPACQTLALRGYIRLAGLAGAATQKLQGFRQAMALASRPEERRLVLAGLAEVAHVDALKMVEAYLDEALIQREALIAYEKIAESLARRQPSAAKAALQRVVDSAADTALRKKARTALDRIKE